jgi:hypothetical protein
LPGQAAKLFRLMAGVNTDASGEVEVLSTAVLRKQSNRSDHSAMS